MELSDISLASLSLDSSTCNDIVCGSNGLPLTPNSVRIIGHFKAQVEHVQHPNLTKYVDCFRNKNERVTLVYEDLPQNPPPNIEFMRVTKQLLDALDHLHRVVDVAHGLITPESIVWSGCDSKLTNWPINLLTGSGSALGASTILPSDLAFIPPEKVVSPERQPEQPGDIWSLGLTLLKFMKPTCKLSENPCRVAFCDSADQVLEKIDGNLLDSHIEDCAKWNEFFRRILHPKAEQRASVEELCNILGFNLKETVPILVPIDPNRFEKDWLKASKSSIEEVYYLWRLSMGRNFESEQKEDDCPPILKIPCLIASEKRVDQSVEFKVKTHIILDTRPKVIPLDKFKEDISRLNPKIFHPLILSNEVLLSQEEYKKSIPEVTNNIVSKKECNNNRKLSDSFTFADLDNLSIVSSIQLQIEECCKALPIVIKEADFAYQCERIVLFKRLLAGCPYLKEQLKREASIDIPPYYRAQTWAILLDVNPDKSKRLYETIDKTTPVATDRQISVDIPRCHQYNELMASPQGHQKLARILKAWLNFNAAEYVYWQGLDSLAAPFLLLNFDDEALAFACFDAFVNKYLKGFFRKDNQDIVQQYLSMFSELLSYHDALLANHLGKLGFLPNLYAIPWFLTMFTHVLPLHRILYVWDCLLLGDEKFPLCIGLAILNQLRQELMGFSFNDCIVAFSDLPEIDIERCIRDATHFYNSTPDKLINLSDIREYQESW